MTTKEENHKTAEFWEGYLAVQTRRDCKYPPDKAEQRREWAKGFAAAVGEGKDGKVWWKSKTIRVGVVCVVIGIGLFLFGQFTANGSSDLMRGAGGGITLSSLLNVFLRTVTNDSVHWGGGGGYTPSWQKTY